jgi:uncharacterized membrane protein
VPVLPNKEQFMKRSVIAYIGMTSAFKVGCFMAIVPAVAVAIIAASTFIVLSNFSIEAVRIVLNFVLPGLLYLLLAGLGGGVAFLFQAFVYNVVSAIFGGLEMNIKTEDTQPMRAIQLQPNRPVKSQFEYPD